VISVKFPVFIIRPLLENSDICTILHFLRLLQTCWNFWTTIRNALLPRWSVFPQSGYWKSVFINFFKTFQGILSNKVPTMISILFCIFYCTANLLEYLNYIQQSICYSKWSVSPQFGYGQSISIIIFGNIQRTLSNKVPTIISILISFLLLLQTCLKILNYSQE